MKVWIAILLFAGTLFAQHAFTPEEIAEGSRLFQSNCTGCHGIRRRPGAGHRADVGKIPARDKRR